MMQNTIAHPLPLKPAPALTKASGPGSKDAQFEQTKYELPAIRLMLVHERRPNQKVFSIKRPSDAIKYLRPLQYASEEQFISLHLNARYEILGIHEVSHGTLSSSLVHPREVFKAALLSNSYAIIVCHNHPSGSSVVPSREDLDTTKQLVEAGKLLGVSVVDHLILGPRTRRQFYSIRENHSVYWD